MSGDSAPTVRTRLLGRELKKVRLARNLSIEAAAAKLDRSASSISRAENGKVRLPERDLPYILAKYGVTDHHTRNRILDLAHAANKKDRSQEHGDLAGSDLLTVESSATTIQEFQPIILPGLLQLRPYARAVFEAVPPKRSVQTIDRFVQLRMMRQRVLVKPTPPHYQAIIGETALYQIVGDRDLMRAQLHRLIEAAQEPRVTIQVLPFSAGAHAGVDGAFTIADVPEIIDGHLVFVDSLTGKDYIEAEADVRRYRLAYDHLRAAALSQPDSQVLIERVADTL